MSALNRQQAADRLGISPEQVTKLIETGALRGFDARSPGAKRASYRVTEDAIGEFIKGREVKRPPRPQRRKRDYPRYV